MRCLRRRDLPAVFLLAGLVSNVGLPPPACADLPALSREFRTERYVNEPGELRAIGAQRRAVGAVAGGVWQGGDDGGSAGLAARWIRVGGGTATAALQLGRWTLGADAIADSWRRVDAGEFATRAAAVAYVPEMRSSLIGSVGFDDGGYAGVDLTAECLAWRWRAIASHLDLRPRVWAWARVRHRDDDGRTVLTPAAALSLQHFVVLGSQLDLALSVQSDLADELLPLSRALVQAGFGSLPRPLWSRGDPDSPDAAQSNIHWNWFTTLAYAVPLDDRARAGLVMQCGTRFLRPFGR